MKNNLGQESVSLPPRSTVERPNVTDQPAAAPIVSPSLFHFHHPDVREHDKRGHIASGEMLQRIRARQMEPRTAVDCHVRTRRRSRLDG
jgi:hypothetical protein